MKFWWSAEASPEVIQECRRIGNEAERRINEALASTPLSEAWRDWKWAFIAIVISPSLGVMYPERVRRNVKGAVFEFRLAIDFQRFLEGDCTTKLALWFEQAEKSVDLMSKWGVSTTDRESLRLILQEVRATMTCPVTLRGDRQRVPRIKRGVSGRRKIGEKPVITVAQQDGGPNVGNRLPCSAGSSETSGGFGHNPVLGS